RSTSSIADPLVLKTAYSSGWVRRDSAAAARGKKRQCRLSGRLELSAMKQRCHVVVGALVASFLSGWHCTQTARICESNLDCTGGMSCISGQCGFPSAGDGGDGGGGNGDGGDGGNGDGGCVNLGCNQVSCPDGGTTTVTGTVYDPSGQ